MDKKSVLKTALATLSLLGLGLLLYPFLASMGPSAAPRTEYVKEIDLTELTEGEVHSYLIGRQQILIMKPTPDQLESLERLNEHVWDKEYASFDGVFVLVGFSTGKRGPCLLKHIPKQKSQLVEYDSRAKWHGGYSDTNCEVSYDYAGRAIKEYMYTYNGFVERLRNLEVPDVKLKSKKLLVVTTF